MSQLRWYHRIACLLALGIAPLGQAQNTAVAVGGLPEDLLPELKPILQRALERSPDQIRRGIEVEQAEAHTYSSRGQMLPNVGGLVRYSANSAATASGSSSARSNSSGFFGYMDLNQPVYHWGALKAQADIDRISVKIFKEEYADAARLLATAVRVRYLELIAKKAALRSSKFQLDLAARGLAREEERLKAGALTQGEMVTLRMNFEEARLGFDRLTAEFAFLKRQLLRLAGLDELSDEAIPLAIPPPAPAADQGDRLLQAFAQGGAAETYRAQIFSLNIRQNDLNYAIQKKRLYPKFSLNAGRSLMNSTQADFNQVRQEAIVQTYYGIVANWTIFDGLATRGAKLEALARKRVFERQLKMYVDSSNDLAQNLRQQVGFSARALEFAETRLGWAKNGVDAANENLSRKVASQDDVDRAIGGLRAAEVTAMAARADYLNRWTEFVSHVGADPAMNNLPPRYVR